MINCDVCEKMIGSEVEPIFVDSEESCVCRSCYFRIEGKRPIEADGQIVASVDASQN